MTERKYEQLDTRGVVTVAGKDRKTFLQGLISNDVERVAADHAIWAALLTPQGKYLHDFFVAELTDVMYLDCERERLMDLGKRLHRYKLRAEVDLGIAENFAVYALFGDDALTAAGLPVTCGSARIVDGGVIYVDPRLHKAGARALLPVDRANEILEGMGFSHAKPGAYDAWRLSLGLSDGSRDLVVEKSTLLESNFDELHGVDWDKGCYMGQELTARTKYRALVRKRLMPVRIEGPVPQVGTPLMAGGKEVGEMRSGVGPRGLALIRLERLAKTGDEEVELLAGKTRLFPEKPEWAEF